MAFEETREQQQMYNYFRSCIYIFLIVEIIMNLPVTADNRVTQFVLDLLARFRIFNSVSSCKVAELVCICIVCIGTKAEKSLKFNVRTMVIYPVLAGLTLVGLCFVFHGMSFGFSWLGFPANRLLYAVCSVVGTMLVHQGLDGIAKYYNYKVGESSWVRHVTRRRWSGHRMMCSERQSRPLVPFPSMTIRYQPQSLRRWTFWFLQPRLRIWQQAGWPDRRHVTLRLPMTVCLTILTSSSRKNSGLPSISARRTLI